MSCGRARTRERTTRTFSLVNRLSPSTPHNNLSIYHETGVYHGRDKRMLPLVYVIPVLPHSDTLVPSQGPATTPTPNKLAMSRALGAAFLSHQVEQLEKSVTRGPASGNWRDRRQPQADLTVAHPNPNRRSGIVTHGAKPRHASGQKQTRKDYVDRERDHPEPKYREKEKPRKSSDSVANKDADLVVVDASVLVHALHQVKKWCREGREEIVVIPLEGWSLLSHIWVWRSPHRCSAQYLGPSQEGHKFTRPESARRF